MLEKIKGFIPKGVRMTLKRVVPLRLFYPKILEVQESYELKIKRISQSIKNKKLKVGFVVLFKTTFPSKPVFEKMMKDSLFDPYIIVVPNINAKKSFSEKAYIQAIESFSEQYPGRVIAGMEGDRYVDFGDNYNILFFSNPYEHLVHPMHHVEHFLDKDVLPIYVSYGFAAVKYWDEVIGTNFYNYMWKTCIETESNLKYLRKKQLLKGKNAVLTGYVKMDSLVDLYPEKRERKRVLICPHHTVWGWKKLDISNFLKYAELFDRLPVLFPEIDFIFRPHPLLFENLITHGIWTDIEVSKYLESLLSNSNVRYDQSADYLQGFLDSDAMIHDCASFMAEYLYAKKPCCYMMKGKYKTMRGLIPLGKECVNNHYQAFNEEDIIAFINSVVLEGKDNLKESRELFAETKLMVNYPHASERVINMIKKELRMCGENRVC